MSIARRLGIDNVVDVVNSDMTKIQGAALKSAFLLIWAEVMVGNRAEETFMIRRKGGGNGLSREISFLLSKGIGRG